MHIISINIAYGEMLDRLLEFILIHAKTESTFCLQEVDDFSKRSIDNLLSGFGYNSVVASKITGDEKFLLVSYFPRSNLIISTNTILLDQPNTGLAIHTTVKVKRSTLDIINVHGHPRPGTKNDTTARLRQSGTIIDYASKLQNLVICGDFNLLPTTKSVELFEDKGYENLISKYAIPTTRNHSAWDRHPHNKQMFADYTFTKFDKNWLVNDFVVPKEIISDHQPMITYLHHPNLTNI